jgi:hypothetical protein
MLEDTEKREDTGMPEDTWIGEETRMPEDTGISYVELSRIVDLLLDKVDEDTDALVKELDHFSPEILQELFRSDLLNAYQAFYYYFREDPGDFERERLELEPASSLAAGVTINEIELLELVFHVDKEGGVISVTDDEQILANFRGKDAYRKAKNFIDETL